MISVSKMKMKWEPREELDVRVDVLVNLTMPLSFSISLFLHFLEQVT